MSRLILDTCYPCPGTYTLQPRPLFFLLLATLATWISSAPSLSAAVQLRLLLLHRQHVTL